MASTFSSRAITGSGLFLTPLYVIADVREITFNASIFAREFISSSVMPSAKYSWAGSLEGLSNGKTASDAMRGLLLNLRVNQGYANTAARIRTTAGISHAAHLMMRWRFPGASSSGWTGIGADRSLTGATNRSDER